MTNTQKRLRESILLLQQAINSESNPELFQTNLNAFLNSARSVTWIMQKEFADVENFKTWYKFIQEKMKNDKIFDFFKNLRNTSVKEKSVGGKIKIETTFGVGGFTIEGGKGKYIIPIGKVGEHGRMILDNESKITRDGKPIDDKYHNKQYYFFDDKPNDNAIELCKTYVERLEKIVKECYDNTSLYSK